MLDTHPAGAEPRDPAGRQAPSETLQVGPHAIVIGDCAGALAEMPPRSVDVIVTSPPYNIGLGYRSYDDGGERSAYLDWIGRVGALLKNVMADEGSLFLNVAGTSADPWIAADVAARLRDLFTLQNSIVWVKSISIGGTSVGHFKPVNSRRFLNRTHETLFHFTKSGRVPLDRLAIGVPFQDKSNIARWGHPSDRRCGGDSWFIPYQTIRSKDQRAHHPAPFPVELPERCIRLHGRPQARVLDPFLGIGSTLLAAEALGCTGIGIELDPVYARAAAERLRNAVEAKRAGDPPAPAREL